MKNRVLVDICGREFALITDEAESYMKALATEVNKMINDSSYKNLRISRNDAALLICLDLCDRKNKLSAANDNMRAQITAYVEEIDTLKKQLEVSEEQLAMKSLRDKSERNDKDEAENDNGVEVKSEEEYEEEIQEQPESVDDDLQDEYADADNINNPDDSEQKENYKTENEIKSKPVQAKSKSASSTSSYGSYLFGSGRNNANAESGSIRSINDNDVENGGESKKREKDFESLKERFNRLQKSMSKP